MTYGYGWGALTSVTASFRDPFVPGEVKTVTALLDYDAAGRVSETKVTTSPLGGQAFRLAVPRDPSGLSRPGAWDLYRRSETDTQEHRTFSYDGSGNVTSIGSSQSLYTSPTSVDSYAYDARGRLTRDALALRAPQSRAYDGFGNLVSVSGADARILLTDRATNRLAERAVYDWAGRMTEDLSRQVQPTDYIVGRDWYPDGGLMAEFAHVPGSNDTLPGPGVSVWLLDGKAEGAFSFWGDNIACDTAKYHSLVRDEGARMLTEYHASTAAPCSCETPCTWQDRYYSDIVRLGPWATAVNDRASGLKLEARDHLGTPRYVVNALGDTTSSVRLDSFGTKITGTGDAATRERFTGHERHHVLDDGTSLPVSDYMHARTYVPVIGRFTRPDPANSFSLFDPQSFNRYAYALSNPVKFVDPTGEDAVLFVRDSGSKATDFGHVALRVFGKGYDVTYDFGRYREARGFLRWRGDGVLRVWKDWNAFRATQGGKGETTQLRIHTSAEFDKAVMSHFDDQAASGKKIGGRGPMTEYKLAEDYNLFTNNCTTQSLEALSEASESTGYSIPGLAPFRGENDPRDVFDGLYEHGVSQKKGGTYAPGTILKICNGNGTNCRFELR